MSSPILQDLRYGIRILVRNRGFAAVCLVTLALGIGANTAIFSILRAVLFRPLPFASPERLVTVWERDPKEGYERNPPAAGNFAEWKAQNHVFESLGAYDGSRRFNLTGAGTPERIAGAAASAAVFGTLRAHPMLGRTFSEAEERPGNDRVALLSFDLWKNRFHEDRAILGQPISLDGIPYEVVGVMPPGFEFPGGTGTVDGITTPASRLWVPLALDARGWQERSNHYLQVIARLREKVTLSQASMEMDAIEARIARQNPKEYVGSHVLLTPLTAQVVGRFRTVLLVLFGAVALVLLIACANVANLLLARAASRRKEIAIRISLGAGQRRIVRQMLAESCVLSLAGGALGILLAVWGIDLLRGIAPETFPRLQEVRVDGAALAFTLCVCLANGLLFGLAPALQASRAALAPTLNEAGRGSAGSAQGNLLRSALVVAQVALAMVLLVGAGLLIRSFLKLHSVAPGFQPDHVVTMELTLPRAVYDRAGRAAFVERLTRESAEVAGIRFAAMTTQLPLTGDNMNFALTVEGRPNIPGEVSPSADVHAVTPDYFRALGAPLLQGRSFSTADTAQSPHVFVVNQALVRRYFAGRNPLGKRLTIGVNNFEGEIVGVVADIRHLGLDAPVHEELFTDYVQTPFWPTLSLLARTSGDPTLAAAALRASVSAIDKDQPIAKVRTMHQIVGASIAQPRFRTLLLALFGALAVVLSGVGLSGVLAYSVAQRTREIGVRIALGAQSEDVLRLVVGQGMSLALAGIGIGLAAALALTRLLSGLLYGIGANDPATFAGIALLLVVVAAAASYFPARRASKVDPIVALRYE